MTEALKANDHQLNQLAKRALEDLGVGLRNDQLYSLQLIRLILDQRRDGLSQADRLDLLELLDLLDYGGDLSQRYSPEQLTAHQIGKEKDGSVSLSLEGLDQEHPLTLAQTLTENWLIRNLAEPLER